MLLIFCFFKSSCPNLYNPSLTLVRVEIERSCLPCLLWFNDGNPATRIASFSPTSNVRRLSFKALYDRSDSGWVVLTVGCSDFGKDEEGVERTNSEPTSGHVTRQLGLEVSNDRSSLFNSLFDLWLFHCMEEPDGSGLLWRDCTRKLLRSFIRDMGSVTFDVSLSNVSSVAVDSARSSCDSDAQRFFFRGRTDGWTFLCCAGDAVVTAKSIYACSSANGSSCGNTPGELYLRHLGRLVTETVTSLYLTGLIPSILDSEFKMRYIGLYFIQVINDDKEI